MMTVTSCDIMCDPTQVVLAQCDETLQWPDTFARDANGTVFVLSNRLDRFFTVREQIYMCMCMRTGQWV